MRSLIIGVIAVLAIGAASKQFFFAATNAAAHQNGVPVVGMDVLQMQIDHPNKSNLPSSELHDATFVFSN
jgi:hypothetical protein